MFNFLKRTPQSTTTIEEVRPNQLKQRLDSGEKFILLDVRSQPEFDRDGRIADSRLIPLPDLLNRQNELPKDQTIVCICRSGARSRMACGQLSQIGYSNVINLQGGMIAWKRSGNSFE